MKKIYLLFILLISASCLLQAQNRTIARGAEPGELYLNGLWYGIYNPIWGPPVYDTLRKAVFRLTENGKKLTIQYDVDFFAYDYTDPCLVMQPQFILADATPGALYSKCTYPRNSYSHTALWVSFDYGENWTLREENIGNVGYFASGLSDGIILKGGENRTVLQSKDYGESFVFYFEVPIPYALGDCSYKECEFLGIGSLYNKELHYTNDCANSFAVIPIDEDFMFGQMGGTFPDVFRGGLSGEVYITSWFPDWSYKVSFSADTGHTFRHVYIYDSYDPYAPDANKPMFMSDREPGVFYILRGKEIATTNPWGWYARLYVDYYRDYGETWVATYCHDITKNYTNEVEIKEIDHELAIYPNPTTGELRVTSYELQNGALSAVEVEVFDVCGRKQKAENRKHEGEILMDISRLQAGIYFVRITTEKGIITKKIVKY